MRDPFIIPISSESTITTGGCLTPPPIHEIGQIIPNTRGPILFFKIPCTKWSFPMFSIQVCMTISHYSVVLRSETLHENKKSIKNITEILKSYRKYNPYFNDFVDLFSIRWIINALKSRIMLQCSRDFNLKSCKSYIYK